MKKLIIILYFIPLLSFSQYFIPFGEDSLYNSYGSPGEVYEIFVNDTICYIGGGAFHFGGNETLYQIGSYYNNNWHTLNNGFGGPSGDALCITKYQNKIYMGGAFQDIDDIPNTKNIGRFNGTSWEALPNSSSVGGLGSYVNDMITFDNQLIIGGGLQVFGKVMIILILLLTMAMIL